MSESRVVLSTGGGFAKATSFKKFSKHKDVKDCERILPGAPRIFRGRRIITDGVFSLDGDIAPWPELCGPGAKVTAESCGG